MGVYTGTAESTGLMAENHKLAKEYGADDNLIFRYIFKLNYY